MARLRRRRALRSPRNQGGWTLGLAAGTIVGFWVANAGSDGSLAQWLNTWVAAWAFAGAVAVLLLAAAQGWPRFAGGFCPPAGTGAVLAGILDRAGPHSEVNLLLPMLSLAAVAIVATFQSLAWERAVHTGHRA